MKKIFPLTFSLALMALMALMASCAGHYRKPESIQEKMTRYTAKDDGINLVPDYYSFERFSAGRRPASKKQKSTPSLNYNNKKLYFLTLYGQLVDLQAYSKYTTPEINICSNFHSVHLNFKNQFKEQLLLKTPLKAISYDFKKFNDDTFLALHPELALPVTAENIYPRVKDLLMSKNPKPSKDVVLNALDIHLTKTYNEIKELCEHGNSQNYYIFENLMTYINQQNNFKSSKKNLKFLMKTTLFSNMALIKSFKKYPTKKRLKGPSRGLASVKGNDQQVFSNEVITRLQADWSRDYLKKINNKR